MKQVAVASLLCWAPAFAAPIGGYPIDENMGRRVQEVLRSHQAAIFGCVAKQPSAVQGEALVRVFVGAGRPRQVDVLKVEPEGLRPVAECVAGDARSWDLSPLAAEDGDQIVFPLTFRPDPSTQSGAVAARLKRVTLARGAHQAERVEHPIALFVSRGSVQVRYEGAHQSASTNEVVYLTGEGQLELTTVAGCEVVRVESSAAPGPVATISIHKPPVALSTAGGKGRVQLFLDGSAAPFAVDKLCAKRGVEVPVHQHESDELVYILSGKTHTLLGTTMTEQTPAQTLVIPRGTPHSLRVDEDMCSVQVYAPPGPEQRFKPKKTEAPTQ